MIVILLFIYLLSAYAWWKYVQISHSIGGVYEQRDRDDDDDRLSIIIVFLPVINTIMSGIGWVSYYPKKRDTKKREIDFVKFFKIKR